VSDSAAQSQPKAAPSRHILVVEDDEINQAVVCGLLRHAGHRVSSAVNGAQAIAALVGPNSFDLVFMDWQMPDIDGLEVTRRLRAGQAGPAGQTVPIVALTANAFAEDRAACLAAGMNDFLSKPVLMADLLAAVARALPQAEAASAAVAVVAAQDAAQDVAKDAPTPVYDPHVLEALPMVADGSAPEYAQELLDLFVSSTSASLRAIQAAAQSDDKKLLQRLLHTLKSSSASVGALQLASLAAAAEVGLRQGHVPAANLHSRLHRSFEAFDKAASVQVSV
jgi:CheY-like chemotaxis protein/HPt (histidine-containing phosphotransfer) domain-containing protein